jgi:hypothetical protein
LAIGPFLFWTVDWPELRRQVAEELRQRTPLVLGA